MNAGFRQLNLHSLLVHQLHFDIGNFYSVRKLYGLSDSPTLLKVSRFTIVFRLVSSSEVNHRNLLTVKINLILLFLYF